MTCTNGSCSTQHSMSSHGDKECCGGCKGGSCCGSCKCCCQSNQACCDKKDCCESMCKDLLHLADKAWMELLMESLKEEIKAADGENIKQLAKIISEHNRKRWHIKMEKKANKEDYEEKMKQLLMSKHSQD